VTDTHLAPGYQVFQNRPSTVTDVVVFTATVRTEITTLFLANTTATAATVRVYHDDDGSTMSDDTILLPDVSVPPKTAIVLEAAELYGGINVSPGGTVGIGQGTASAINFTAYGVRQRKTRA
jgi:hypothetical protein